MSTTMKWVIGILAGMAIVFFIFSVGFLVITNLNGSALEISARSLYTWERGIPRDILPWGHIPVLPNRFRFDGIFRNIFPFGNTFGMLFGLGFLVLIGLGIASLVLILRHPRQAAAAVVSDVPSALLTEPIVMQTPTRPCPNCQRPVVDEWNHCPYCGTSLTPLE